MGGFSGSFQVALEGKKCAFQSVLISEPKVRKEGTDQAYIVAIGGSIMANPMKFGRKVKKHPSFFINELEFSSLPLSLAEEKLLAQTGQNPEEDEVAFMDGMLGSLAVILNARRVDDKQEVDSEWLLENLSPRDLEGIVEHLRQE